MNDFVEIGRIVKPFGLRGQVKVVLYLDDPRSFFYFDEIFIKTPLGFKRIYFVEPKILDNGVVSFVENFNSIDDVILLKGKSIYVKKESLPEKSENEFYISDLMGAEAVVGGEPFGFVENIFESGDRFILVVEVYGRTKMKSIAVPFTDEYVERVDEENKKIFLKKSVRDLP